MRKLSLPILLGVVLGLSTGVAAAATAPSLSRTECRQLLSFQARASTRSLKTLAAVKAARRSCHDLSPISALMRSGRSDCNATYAWLESSVDALARVKACAPTHTVAARFSCLMSAYARLAGATRAMYRDDQRLHRVVVRRGFTGACVRALSDGPKTLSHEQQMSRDITELVAAMRRRSLLAVQKWGSLYDAATAEGEASAPKVSVAVCPHR